MPESAVTPADSDAAGRQLLILADRLAGVDHLTESAFLIIGEQVRDGRRLSLELTKRADEALQAGEGESAEQIVARLQLLTERGALWLSEASDQSQGICTILKELERNSEALSLPQHGLAKIIKTLQALRVATRIEAARSHGHGALVLGQELQILAGLMQDKLGFIHERRDVLVGLCRRATSLEEQAQSGPLREADGEIRRTRLLLGGVAAQCVRTTDHAVDVHRRAAELAGNFAELVAALQFQDITRQRLQHIRVALEEVATEGMNNPASQASFGEICLLQHDQLQRAVDEFCEAAVRLDGNLRKLASGVRGLADDACAILSVGRREHRAMVSPALQAVTTCLANVQTMHLAAGQAVFAVCQAVRDVASLSGEIERLGEEMQLLAQNAAVSAAHGQERAAGLTVIAGNIQDLAEEAGRCAVAMVDCCRLVSERAEELDARDQLAGGRDADLDALLEDARRLIEHLEQGRMELDVHITAFNRQADELAVRTETALAGLNIRDDFLKLTEPVAEQLRSLALEHALIVAGDAGRDQLDGMQKRYTMKSERDIHQRFVLRHDQVAANEAHEAVVSGPFGSNVELF